VNVQPEEKKMEQGARREYLVRFSHREIDQNVLYSAF
jgi:hypothetical protein